MKKTKRWVKCNNSRTKGQIVYYFNFMVWVSRFWLFCTESISFQLLLERTFPWKKNGKWKKNFLPWILRTIIQGLVMVYNHLAFCIFRHQFWLVNFLPTIFFIFWTKNWEIFHQKFWTKSNFDRSLTWCCDFNFLDIIQVSWHNMVY